jgi:ABC-type multidrug transport system fused ATPase/permease subunit
VRRPRFDGAVRFEDVSFEYGRLEPVLRDINLEVKPGECVAILGATGAGKSVLMSLIPRFYDVSEAGC